MLSDAKVMLGYRSTSSRPRIGRPGLACCCRSGSWQASTLTLVLSVFVASPIRSSPSWTENVAWTVPRPSMCLPVYSHPGPLRVQAVGAGCRCCQGLGVLVKHGSYFLGQSLPYVLSTALFIRVLLFRL